MGRAEQGWSFKGCLKTPRAPCLHTVGMRLHHHTRCAPFSKPGRRPLRAAVPGVTLRSREDTAALPRPRWTSPAHHAHSLLLRLVLTRGLGPPGADARGALRLWAPAGLARHPFPGSPSHGVATRAPSTGPSQEAAPTASQGGGLRPGRVSPGPDVSSVTFPTP